MQSNYKSLGEHIRLVKVKNSDDSVKELLGINIDKFFMPSVANIVGTDLSKYQIVQKNQFACNRMHVGRDYRIPVAKSDSDFPFIVSPAYDVFEIIDESILLPDYLMLWFKRREFDRNAWFYTDADVRGGLHWKAFIEIKLPIPSLEKQKELIEEYEAIENRIQLNKKLCATLEETAQTIYKHWFEDFEFPDENEKPYQSSGGEMVECEELGKEIPKGWRSGKISDLVSTQYGFTASANFENGNAKLLRITDIVGTMIKWNDVPFCDISEKEFTKYRLAKGDLVISRTGANVGFAKLILSETSDSVFASFLVRLKVENASYQNFVSLKVISDDYKRFVLSIAEGSAQPQANANILTKMQIIIPDDLTGKKFNDFTNPLLEKIEKLSQQIEKLEELKSLLLGKMAVKV